MTLLDVATVFVMDLYHQRENEREVQLRRAICAEKNADARIKVAGVDFPLNNKLTKSKSE